MQTAVSTFDAIVEGRHGDAFAVLGPRDAGSGYEVTAWLPQAQAAALVVQGIEIPMRRISDAGFYRGLSERRDYKIRVQLYSGESQIVEDPYRFPPLLTSFELH